MSKTVFINFYLPGNSFISPLERRRCGGVSASFFSLGMAMTCGLFAPSLKILGNISNVRTNTVCTNYLQSNEKARVVGTSESIFIF